MIDDIAFIAYAVADMPRAIAFYRDAVGLTLAKTFNDAFVEFGAGSATFAFDAEPAGYEPGSCSGVAFEVDDVEAVRDRLNKHGATVGPVHEFRTCSICFAQDPDGNRFAIHRRKT